MNTRPEKGMLAIDPAQVPDSPSWVIDMAALEDNLKILDSVQRAAGCKILLALKGFATFPTFPLIKKYLAGATASSPHEASSSPPETAWLAWRAGTGGRSTTKLARSFEIRC